MPVNPNHLRPGNWIYPTGRSKYVVVTGLLLGMMEKNEDLCKEFEGIELTAELLGAAGFVKDEWDLLRHPILKCRWITQGFPGDILDKPFLRFDSILRGPITDSHKISTDVYYLHHLQNIHFDLVGRELPLPESAKIIPQATK